MAVVYRLGKAQHATDLSGEGARRAGGRWNERLTPALYTGGSVALALLECRVHVGDPEDLPDDYTVTVIEVSDASGGLPTVEELPPNRAEAQSIGTALLDDDAVLGFWVPSVIVPTERNLVLNPRARGYERLVRVRQTYVLPVDPRLR